MRVGAGLEEPVLFGNSMWLHKELIPFHTSM